MLAHSAARIVSRTLGWGATGLGLSVLMCLSWLAAGVYPGVWWGTALLVVVTLIGITGGLGYVGWIRGLGRAGIYVGCERGMVTYLVGAILDRVTGLMRKSRRVSAALDAGEDKLANLPLQQWESWLTQGVDDYLGVDDPELGGAPPGMAGKVVVLFRGFLVGQVKRLLLAVVREEAAADGSGGGVSIARVREVGLELADEKVTELVEGVMQTHLLIGVAASLAWFVLPFPLAWYAGW
ncbi:MAG: hypothetical protein H6736_00690 [Alphaproteobacteria bacterium]|nr:hypothetical protein [Alphaproteobacteria bacterium]